MSWNVLITASPIRETGQKAEQLLRERGCNLIYPQRLGFLSEEELLQNLEDIDAVLASVDQYSARVLESKEASRLKIISRWGVGYDSIHVDKATDLGIVIGYTPGMLNDAVAEYTVGLIFALARGIHEGHYTMKQDQWTPSWGREVVGKTLGLIGCGRIGQTVAQMALAFRMKVIAFDPHPSEEMRQGGVSFVPLDELLETSDFITMHAAVTAETQGLLNSERINKMKKSAYLINTARGALVDEEALLQALRAENIAGAALDVFHREPLPTGHPLRNTPRLLLTPHQASYTLETGERVSLAAAQTIVDLMQERRPLNVVNPVVFDSHALRTHVQPHLAS